MKKKLSNYFLDKSLEENSQKYIKTKDNHIRKIPFSYCFVL